MIVLTFAIFDKMKILTNIEMRNKLGWIQISLNLTERVIVSAVLLVLITQKIISITKNN